MKARNIIIALCVQHHNDWGRVYKALQDKEQPNCEDIDAFVSRYENQCVTILDEDYPQRLKQSFRPPFVLWFEGDKSYLSKIDKDDKTDSLVFLYGENVFNIPESRLITITDDHKIDIAGHLKVWFNNESTSIDRFALAPKLCSKMVLTKEHQRNSRSWITAAVTVMLQQGGDVYCRPTVNPSLENGFIKDGAYLMDCYEDLFIEHLH